MFGEGKGVHQQRGTSSGRQAASDRQHSGRSTVCTELGPEIQSDEEETRTELGPEIQSDEDRAWARDSERRGGDEVSEVVNRHAPIEHGEGEC